jgi:hypothetical protein
MGTMPNNGFYLALLDILSVSIVVLDMIVRHALVV